MIFEDMIPNIGFHRARISPNSEAVFDYDNNIRYTYAQMEARAERLAAFLTEELGLVKGDRVAFCSDNAVPWLDAFFMSYRTGIIMTSYNCMMGKPTLQYLVAKEDPKVVFYASRRRDVIEYYREQNPGREYIAILGGPDERDHYTYADVMAYQPKGTAVYDPPAMEDIQMLIHTGGTTGEPKAAMMSYRAILFNAISGILSVGIDHRDSAHIMLPFFHTAGWNVVMLPLLLVGGRIIITAGFRPDAAMDIVTKERPTVGIAVETMYRMMAAHPGFAKADFSCFRWLLNGAAPISRDTLEAFWAKDVKLVNAYGMTEIGPNNLVPPINQTTQDEMRAKWNAAGKPLFFNNVRVVDDDGNDVAPGEHGELLFSGPLTFSGYWQDEEQTREIVDNGWIHTGDIGYVDQDGYYYICARKKNMFISGGENIYPVEIEQVLCGHPAVGHACVIGVPDKRWGEVGKAIVVLAPGQSATKEELQNHVRTESSSIKIPKYVQFVEDIPKNAVGKMDLTFIRVTYGASSDE